MIGKKMPLALALAVALLGSGLTVAPASAQVACKCAKKVRACKVALKAFYNCKSLPTRAEKKACKRARTAAIQAECHNCTKPCSSPSGAFLD